MTDEDYMRLALELAGEAAREGEVPVGAVIGPKRRGYRRRPQPPGNRAQRPRARRAGSDRRRLRPAGGLAAFRVRFVW